MKECIVICTLRKKEIRNEMFDSYDEAFEYARSMTENKGLTSLILCLDKDTLTWKTRIRLDPSESC